MTSPSPSPSPSSPTAKQAPTYDDLVDEGKLSAEGKLSLRQREMMRCSQLKRKKDFVLVEKVQNRGRLNVLEGLELHTGVFNDAEQKKIVDCVYKLQILGESRKLMGRTYSKPKKWMRGKGRITMQFGCCYNYAKDMDGNPPGIILEEEVEPLPPLFKSIIQRLVRWRVLPSSCVPDSCIVNIYEAGDCIPPHIDHHDFLRPFCTVSFLSECNILFGSALAVTGEGDFSGPAAIPLPVGSVLVLKGNGADVAKHCVPGVPAKRISVTFRKMDRTRLPFNYAPDPDLQGLQHLQLSPVARTGGPGSGWRRRQTTSEEEGAKERDGADGSSALQPRSEEAADGGGFRLVQDEFPPLRGPNCARKSSTSNRGAS